MLGFCQLILVEGLTPEYECISPVAKLVHFWKWQGFEMFRFLVDFIHE